MYKCIFPTIGWILSFSNLIYSNKIDYIRNRRSNYELNYIIWIYYSYRFLTLRNSKWDLFYLLLGFVSNFYNIKGIFGIGLFLNIQFAEYFSRKLLR